MVVGFETDEEPTRPKTKQYKAARFLQIWNMMSEKDQDHIMRFMELAAKDNDPEVEFRWS